MPAPAAPRRALPWLAALLPASAAFLAIYRDVLFRGEVFSARDHAAFYWPVKSYLASSIRAAGGLPLWNPVLAAGQPLAANPEHAFFHPLTPLFLVLPFETAYVLQVLLLVAVLAAAGAFLARSLGLSRAVASVSAVAWAHGALALSALDLVPILLVLAPLPAALGYAVRLGARRDSADVVGFAVTFGLMALGGEPSTLLSGVVLSVTATLHGARLSSGPPETRPRPARALLRLIAAGAFGGALGAAALLPGVVHARRTSRAAGLPPTTAYVWTFPAARLPALAIPDPYRFGRPGDPAAARGRRLYPVKKGPFFATIYPGILLLAGVAVAWSTRRNAEIVWMAPTVLGVLLALGPATPLLPLLRTAAPFSGLRFPERFLVLTLGALVVAGTCGLARLLDREEGAFRRAALGSALALGAAASVVAFVGVPARAVVADAARQVVALGGGVAAVALAARSRPASLASLLPAAALAADLVAAGRPFVTSAPPIEMRAVPAPVAALLRTPPRGYVFHAAAQDPVRGDVPAMASPPFLAQFGLATALDRDFDLTELAWSARATGAVLRALSANPGLAHVLLARRGIAAIVAFRRDAPPTLEEARRRRRAELLSVLAVSDPQPFAFVADRISAAGDEAGWRRAVESAGTRARSLVVVDPRDAPWPLPGTLSPGRVSVVSRAACRVVLSVDAQGPGPSFVAVNQTWDPGWRATLGGAPLPLVRTDLSLCGVLVPPGRHEVVLSYRSVAVTAGVAVSLAGLVAAAAVLRRRGAGG